MPTPSKCVCDCEVDVGGPGDPRVTALCSMHAESAQKFYDQGVAFGHAAVDALQQRVDKANAERNELAFELWKAGKR